MLWSRLASSLLLLASSTVSAIPLVAKRDVCVPASPNQIVRVFITVEVVRFPVLIDRFFPVNTVVNVGAGFAITIRNAPTQVRTVVQGGSTITRTVTSTLIPANNGQPATRIAPVFNIVNFPVFISTFIQQNTIINNNGAIIIVTNAPTTIITTATGTSTVTTTVTQTVTPTSEVFVLSPIGAAAVGRRGLARRQSSESFVGGSGQLVQTCEQAARYTISNGRLLINNALISANPGEASIIFAPSGEKSIQTEFSIGGGRLSWSNTAFVGGAAIFAVENGRIVARFNGNSGGEVISLDFIPVAACFNGIRTSSTTGASTTQASTSAGQTTSTSAAVTTSAGQTTSTSAAVTTSAGQTTSTSAAVTTSAGETTSTSAAVTTSAGQTTSTSAADATTSSTTSSGEAATTTAAAETTSTTAAATTAAETTTTSSDEAPTTTATTTASVEATTASIETTTASVEATTASVEATTASVEATTPSVEATTASVPVSAV